MKIHERISKVCQQMDEILNKSDLDQEEEIYALLQMTIKTYLMSYENDKDLFLECVNSIYDDLEEQGNILGIFK